MRRIINVAVRRQWIHTTQKSSTTLRSNVAWFKPSSSTLLNSTNRCFTLNKWQQQQEEVPTSSQPISFALYIANSLVQSNEIDKLNQLLTEFLDTYNNPQSQNFHDELAEIDHKYLEKIIIGSVSKTKIPVHKAYHSMSELMTLVNRIEEAQYFNDQSLKTLNVTEKTKDKAQHALYELKRANLLHIAGDEQTALELYRANIKELGPHINKENGHLISRVYYELGADLINQDKIKQSIPDLEKAFSIAESYYGWVNPQTSRIAVLLSRVYLDSGRVDFGIILAEKALIGVELFPQLFSIEELTALGTYLSRAYERKKYFPYQHATITRTFNLLKRRKTTAEEDPRYEQTYKKCVFKLENMLASSRFVQGDFVVAFTIFKKLNDQIEADENFFEEWKEKDEVEATLEKAFMKYFRGATLVRTGNIIGGIDSFEESREAFSEIERDDWVQQVDINISEAKQQMEKPPVPDINS